MGALELAQSSSVVDVYDMVQSSSAGDDMSETDSDNPRNAVELAEQSLTTQTVGVPFSGLDGTLAVSEPEAAAASVSATTAGQAVTDLPERESGVLMSTLHQHA